MWACKSLLFTESSLAVNKKKVVECVVTVWVAGLTHIVLLAKNVILSKERKENNSPTHKSELFCSTGTFLIIYDVINRKLMFH